MKRSGEAQTPGQKRFQEILSSRPEFLLLVLLAFSAPIMGGHVSTDPTPLVDGLAELFGGPALPLMTRALFGVLVFGGLAYVLLKKPIIQVPNLWVGASLLGLLACFGLSIAASPFPSVAFVGWQQWLLYGGVFFFTLACVGRRSGPDILLGAFVAGASVTALRGVLEYLQIMAVEPTFRVHAGWNNPNAAASLLVMALPLALALATLKKGGWRLAGALAIVVITACLFLTQSRGGFLAALVGLVSFGVLIATWKCSRGLWVALLALAIGSAVGIGLPNLAKPQAAAPGAARVTNFTASAEQSQGFRRNLWQGSLDLIQQSPFGTGAGSYRYLSAKPGLTEQTVFTHQSYLQIGVEAGVLGLVAFTVLLGAWLIAMLRRTRELPRDRSLMKAATLAAILAACAHAVVETNLAFSGVGILFFALLATGLQLSHTVTSPEYVPAKVRFGLLIPALLPLFAMVMAGQAELARANVATAVASQNRDALASALEGLGNDPESLYQKGLYAAKDEAERVKLFTEAARGLPSTRVLRALARAQAETGDLTGAETSLRRALRLDPKNLTTLKTLVEIQDKAGLHADAMRTAQQLIAVEGETIFKVRALPELIPLETYEARVYLASRPETSPAQKSQLLNEAVRGYLRYLETTFPQAEKYPGEGKERAREKMQEGEKTAQLAIEANRAIGDVQNAEFNESASRRFAEAVAGA